MEKVTSKKLAGIYGVSEKTVKKWQALGLFTKGPDRLIDLEAAVRGIYQHQKELAVGQGSDELIAQRTRIARADAERKELELSQLRGDLLPAEAVRKDTFALSRAVRDTIENIPGRISAILAAETSEHKVRELLAGELRQALQELSK
jgi:phage terminase Nu1 subunit (DNA packaging protein)